VHTQTHRHTRVADRSHYTVVDKDEYELHDHISVAYTCRRTRIRPLELVSRTRHNTTLKHNIVTESLTLTPNAA